VGESADRPLKRRRLDVVGIVGGVVVLALTMAAARATLADVEVDLFRVFNDLPEGLRLVLWPLMQYGTFFTIPVLAAAALIFRRWRLAAALAVAGGGVYLLAKVIKDVVERGRPDSLIDDVRMREVFQEGSLGFPSGHAAVAAALTVVAAGHLPRGWSYVGLGLAVVVALGRMYVGAHLPLDIVGGFALGVITGCAANLIFGVRHEAARAAGAG
jgi:glycosyltransferase 2 family protein